MSAELLIKNALTVRGDGSTPNVENILIDTVSGTILACGASVGEGTFAFDADGACAFPTFTDIACRFADPAYPQRDSIATASSAAIGGGFLNVACLPYQSGEAVSVGRSSTPCRITPILPTACERDITEERNAIYTDILSPITDRERLRDVMLACRRTDSRFIPACLDTRLAGDGVMHGGKTARLLGVPAIPQSAVLLPLIEALALSNETGCKLHIPAVFGAESAALVRYAKAHGTPVTCGTSPLYFSMTDSDLFYYGGSAKLMPPLGDGRDREAVCEALADGTIDCISSLHAPLSKSESCADLKKRLFGASGLDTVFSASVTYLLKRDIVTLDRLASLLAVAPARILGRSSELAPGAVADIVIADPDAETVVSSNTIKSKSPNTPYLGMTFSGCIRTLFLSGIRIL